MDICSPVNSHRDAGHALWEGALTLRLFWVNYFTAFGWELWSRTSHNVIVRSSNISTISSNFRSNYKLPFFGWSATIITQPHESNTNKQRAYLFTFPSDPANAWPLALSNARIEFHFIGRFVFIFVSYCSHCCCCCNSCCNGLTMIIRWLIPATNACEFQRYYFHSFRQ